MRGRLRAAAALLAALTATAGGSALADAPPPGLGPPDVIGVTQDLQIGGILVPASGCPGFAAGDTLTFASATDHSFSKEWDTTTGPLWRETRDEVTAATSAGGFTYTLRGNYTSSDPFEFLDASGRTAITRSDGASMRGTTRFVFDDLASPPINEVTWLEPPSCG